MISEIEFVTGKIGDRFCRLGVELIVRLVDDDPTRVKEPECDPGNPARYNDGNTV
jgi:hypothetical protein